MTREYMIGRSWKPYMLVEIKTSNMPEPVECMLASIDFENEVCTLLPIPNDIIVEDFIYNVSIDYVSVPRPKPKLVK